MFFSPGCFAVAASAPSAVASVSSHATAFVYPMSPARQQSVGSSVTSGQGAQQDESRSSRGTGESSTEGGEGDHAIVSSSDDQTVQDEVRFSFLNVLRFLWATLNFSISVKCQNFFCFFFENLLFHKDKILHWYLCWTVQLQIKVYFKGIRIFENRRGS